MYGFDTKNTHAFKIVKLLKIPLLLQWAGDNVHIFICMSWKSKLAHPLPLMCFPQQTSTFFWHIFGSKEIKDTHLRAHLSHSD